MIEAFAPTYAGKVPIPSPEITALTLAALNLTHDDKVLEISTGSGYQTFMLQSVCGEVHTIELQPQFSPIREAGSVYFHAGDGSSGLPDSAPYTAIVATCGVLSMPRAWEEQLAEGGRMILPLGVPECQRLSLFMKVEGRIRFIRTLAYVRFLQMETDRQREIKPVYKEK